MANQIETNVILLPNRVQYFIFLLITGICQYTYRWINQPSSHEINLHTFTIPTSHTTIKLKLQRSINQFHSFHIQN